LSTAVGHAESLLDGVEFASRCPPPLVSSSSIACRGPVLLVRHQLSHRKSLYCCPAGPAADLPRDGLEATAAAWFETTADATHACAARFGFILIGLATLIASRRSVLADIFEVASQGVCISLRDLPGDRTKGDHTSSVASLPNVVAPKLPALHHTIAPALAVLVQQARVLLCGSMRPPCGREGHAAAVKVNLGTQG
jgi:hypothetical protein